MKKSFKIILFVCVILIAILIVIISGIKPKSNEENKTNTNTTTNTNTYTNSITSSNNDGYIQISYKTTSEVYRVQGTEHTITVNQDFPTVTASDEKVQNTMQSVLGGIANKEFSEYKNQVEERLNDKYGIDAEYMEHVGDLSLNWHFSNSRNDNKVVSVKNESNGSLGGVSWSTKRGYSFSSETGNLLKIEDIAIHTEACKKFINETIIKYFKENYSNLGISADTLSNLEGTIKIDDCTWYLSDSGLTICFEEHTVLPIAFEYTIEYSKLNGYVKPEYLK